MYRDQHLANSQLRIKGFDSFGFEFKAIYLMLDKVYAHAAFLDHFPIWIHHHEGLLGVSNVDYKYITFWAQCILMNQSLKEL